MRYYRVTMHVKTSDRYTTGGIAEAARQAVAERYRGLIVLKSDAELITPSQAGEKKT